MDYLEVIKKSWEFIKKYRYLWFLGLLSGGASFGGNSNYSYSGDGTDKGIENIINGDSVAILNSATNSAKAEVSSVSKVLGEAVGPGALGNVWLWVACCVLVLVIVVALIYISITTRSAIVWSVSKLDAGREVFLKESWMAGHKIFWRRFSLAILMFALAFVPMALFAVPVVILIIFEMYIPAVILGFILGLVLLIYYLLLAVVYPYSERVLVLDKSSAVRSMYEARDIFKKKWREIIIMYLIIMGIRLVAMFVMVLAALVAFVILAVPTFVVYQANHYTSYALGGIFALVLLLAFLAAAGALNAYSSSCVTLTYNRIK